MVEAAAAAAPAADPEAAPLWVPRFRHPRDLLSSAAQTSEHSDLQARLARQELAALGVPSSASGIKRTAVVAALRQQPIVQALAAFVDVPAGRRFGEVREWLARLTGSADVDHQALIRWVL